MVDRGPVSKRGAFGRLAITVMTTAAVVAVIVVAVVVLVLRYQHEDGPGEVYTEAGPGTNAFMPKPSAPTDEERYLYGRLSEGDTQYVTIRVYRDGTFWEAAQHASLITEHPPMSVFFSADVQEANRRAGNITAAARLQYPAINLDELPHVQGGYPIKVRVRANY